MVANLPFPSGSHLMLSMDGPNFLHPATPYTECRKSCVTESHSMEIVFRLWLTLGNQQIRSDLHHLMCSCIIATGYPHIR